MLLLVSNEIYSAGSHPLRKCFWSSTTIGSPSSRWRGMGDRWRESTVFSTPLVSNHLRPRSRLQSSDCKASSSIPTPSRDLGLVCGYIHSYHPFIGSVKLETGSSRSESAKSHRMIGYVSLSKNLRSRLTVRKKNHLRVIRSYSGLSCESSRKFS